MGTQGGYKLLWSTTAVAHPALRRISSQNTVTSRVNYTNIVSIKANKGTITMCCFNFDCDGAGEHLLSKNVKPDSGPALLRFAVVAGVRMEHALRPRPPCAFVWP